MVKCVSDEGLSEVIGFVMIIAIVVAALGMYMMFEVPLQGRNMEISHMDDIRGSFVNYKQTLDSAWMNSVGAVNLKNARNSNNIDFASLYGVVMGNSIALGTASGQQTSGGMFSFFTPLGSGGEVSVDQNDGEINITFVRAGSSGEVETMYSGSLGSLTYKSRNNYWVDQEYKYKMGGLFLSQNNGVSPRVTPLISVYGVNSADRGLVACLNIVPLRILGTQSISGSGTVMFDTRLREQLQTTTTVEGKGIPHNVAKITVKIRCSDTAEATAWRFLLNDQIAREGMGNACSVRVENGEYVILEINGLNDNLDADDVQITMFNAEFKVSLQNMAYGVST